MKVLKLMVRSKIKLRLLLKMKIKARRKVLKTPCEMLSKMLITLNKPFFQVKINK